MSGEMIPTTHRDKKIAALDVLIQDVDNRIKRAQEENNLSSEKTLCQLIDIVVESDYLDLMTQESHVEISDLKRMANDLKEGTEKFGPSSQEDYVSGINALVEQVEDSLAKDE